MTLHPDFPEAKPDAGRWSQPDPLADISCAFDTAGAGWAFADLASVTEYDIVSDDGKWAPGGTVATELSMYLVGTLNDGRWFALEAWNDYTGWGCQDGADIYFGQTKPDVIANGLTEEGRNHLGLSIRAGD